MSKEVKLNHDELLVKLGLQILCDQLDKVGNELIIYGDFRKSLRQLGKAQDETIAEHGIFQENRTGAGELGKILTDIGKGFAKQHPDCDGLLDALVVGKYTGVPGAGFSKVHPEFLEDPVAQEKFVAEQVLILRKYWKENRKNRA